MILKCAIVDDEPLALELLKSYVKKTPVLELNGAYSSAIEAMKMLPDNLVDLLFLDIQMPELNGLEFSPHGTRRYAHRVYYGFRYSMHWTDIRLMRWTIC